MSTAPIDASALVRDLTEARFGALERRFCTALSPMQPADKDRYRWGHPDAVILKPFFNLVLCECPHCKLAFTCLPPAHDD